MIRFVFVILFSLFPLLSFGIEPDKEIFDALISVRLCFDDADADGIYSIYHFDQNGGGSYSISGKTGARDNIYWQLDGNKLALNSEYFEPAVYFGIVEILSRQPLAIKISWTSQAKMGSTVVARACQ